MMGDGISDLEKRGLPFGSESKPRNDGRCDKCGNKLPAKGVFWAGDFKWHKACAPSWHPALKDTTT